jgi:hypothetical protein
VQAAGDEEYTKVRVPIIDSGASDEELLYFVTRFNRAVVIMGWNHGNSCLQNFERHLQGSFLSDWTQVVDAADDAAVVQPPVHDMVFYTDAVGNFMADLFDKADWTEQADYIWTLQKPKTMTPKQFLSRLQHLVSMLASFPQAPANIFTKDELKRIYLYAHPTNWVDHFENAGMTAASESISDIKRYMERQAAKEALSAPRQAKNRNNNNNNGNGNGSSNNTGNSNRCSRGRNCGRGNNRNSNNSGGRGGNRNQNQGRGGNQARTQASNPCPLAGHASHTWGNCNMNVYNPNYRQAPV